MHLLMENRCFGERFIASAANLSYQEFFNLVAKHMNKPAPSVNVPPLLTGLAWRIEAVRSALTGSKPEVTREMAVTTTQVYTYTNDKIRSRLGFEFREVGDSIRETCEIYLKDIRS
jgi:nucleoside-diphosphate-sugar epimerase